MKTFIIILLIWIAGIMIAFYVFDFRRTEVFLWPFSLAAVIGIAILIGISILKNKIMDYKISINAMREDELYDALLGNNPNVTPSTARKLLKSKYHYEEEQIRRAVDRRREKNRE